MADQYTVQVKIQGQNALSQPVNQAQQSLRGLTQEAGRTNQAMSQLKTLGMGLFAGASLAGVARMAEDLYQTGMNAQRAGMLFKSFGAQVGDTDVLLERLRQTTRGVISDTDLMSAASSQLSMGLARNASDVERLTNIGVTFAQAMGTDVAYSLENLNMILANQSYLRLDTLGISSAQVRELAEGYRKAGMDSSEAFTAAFLEVAEGKLPQMSQVADATVTEFQKLSTAMDNWWSDFGERFAQGVNGLIGIAKYGGLAISTALFGETFGQAMARGRDDAALSAIAQQMAGQGGGLESWSSIRQIMSGALNFGVSPGQLTDSQLRDLFNGTAPGTSTINLATRGLMQYQLQQAGVPFGPYTGGAADWAHIGGQLPPGAGRWTPWSTQQSASMGMWRAGERADYSFLPIMQQYEATMRALDAERLGMQGAAGRRTLFSAEEAANAERIADQMEMIAARAAEISTDTDLAGTMERAAAGAREFATFAQAGADALKNMSLSQAMGQTTGGRLGELTDLAMAALEGAGIADGITSGFQNRLDQISGRETALSLWMDKNFGPMVVDVVDQYGEEAGTQFVEAMNAAIDQAATGRPFDPATMLPYMYQPGTGGGTGEGSYTIQPGDTLGAIAASRGMSVEELAAINGITNPGFIVAGQTLNFGTGGSLVPNKGYVDYEGTNPLGAAEESAKVITDEMNTAVTSLSDGLDGVFSKEYSLQLAVKAVDSAIPQWLKDLIKSELVTLVTGNGGVTPGTTNYNSRGGGSGTGRGFVVNP